MNQGRRIVGRDRRWRAGRFLLLVALGILAWRIIVLGLAEHYAGRGNLASALVWYPSHPQALFLQARLLAEADAQKAEKLLAKAAWENPTDGRVFMALARNREQAGELQSAEELAILAGRLAPMRGEVQLAAAGFWLRRGQFEQAFRNLSTALEVRPGIRGELYPFLLDLAEDPRTRAAFGVFLKEPPSWWEGFFRYAAANAEELDTLRSLYHRNGYRPSLDERDSFLARLQREDRWLEMYFVWLNSLDAQQLAALGNVYDGSFELGLSEQGLGWRVQPVRGVSVETVPTYGARGSRALHLVFEGKRSPFRHLYQYLFLEPGRYRLTGLVKLDNLRAARGVQWTVRCLSGEGALLGASNRFLGAADWQAFDTEFAVPAEACPAQELRLELAGRHASDFEAEGEVWFDNLAIRRIIYNNFNKSG